jgi:hypothetical protein
MTREKPAGASPDGLTLINNAECLIQASAAIRLVRRENLREAVFL